MTDLTIDGGVFRVEIEGPPARPVVLLSSSLGADLSLWDAQMPALLEHFRVVRYDSRGHGGTTADGAPYSLARLGADALAILDALSIETAHFVGISMGGAVGLWLLLNAPERITRAVLANTAARFGTPDDWNRRIATVLSQGVASLASPTMERWFSDDFRKSAADRVASVEAAFRATQSVGYAACCTALRDMDLREALHGVDRPVLIITGRDDPVTSQADIASMTKALRTAQHVVLESKHISNIEAETAFNAAVVKFLTGRVATRLARPRVARKLAAATRRPRSGRGTAARSPLKAARPKTTPSAERAGGKVARAKVGVPGPASTDGRAAAASRPARKSSPKEESQTKGPSTRATKKAAAGKTSKPAKETRATIPTKKASKASVAKKTTAKKAAAKKVSSARRQPARTHRRSDGRRKR